MNRVVVPDRKPLAAKLSTLGLLAGLILLPAIVGCPGTLSSDFNMGGSGGAAPGATGGATGTGSGGTNGGGTGGSPTQAGTGGSSMPANCPTDMPMAIATSCGGGSCHDPGFASVWQDLVSPGVASRLINKPARASMMCNGETLLVRPSKPAAGVLFERLNTATCGLQKMPPATMNPNPLPPANFVDCLKTWLEPQLN